MILSCDIYFIIKLSLAAGTMVQRWGPLDDVVMGGRSKSNLYASKTASADSKRLAAIFSGNVTGANNGGCAPPQIVSENDDFVSINPPPPRPDSEND